MTFATGGIPHAGSRQLFNFFFTILYWLCHTSTWIRHSVHVFPILKPPTTSCFSDDPADVGNLISGSSAFSKTNLNIWKFKVHILLKPGLENFEHYLASMWDECNCAVVWVFFGIAFLWDWNENWSFSSLVATAEFSKLSDILSAALSQHHLLRSEIAC